MRCAIYKSAFYLLYIYTSLFHQSMVAINTYLLTRMLFIYNAVGCHASWSHTVRLVLDPTDITLTRNTGSCRRRRRHLVQNLEQQFACHTDLLAVCRETDICHSTTRFLLIYDTLQELQVAVWLSGNIGGRVNEVTLRRAGLVLRWVTVRGYTVLVSNQATQAHSAWPSLRG